MSALYENSHSNLHPKPSLSRRRLLQITAAMGGLLLAGGAASTLAGPRTYTHTATRWLMGTTIHLTVVAPSPAAAQQVVNATLDEMARLVAIFDHRQPASPLATLNQVGRLDQPPTELVAVMQHALAYGELTHGAFDVTVKPLLDAYRAGVRAEAEISALRSRVDYRQISVMPNQIRLGIRGAGVTLDGIAKGWIIDAALATLQQLGCERVLVEAGGDLRTLGMRQDNGPWRVGIVHPRQSDALITTLTVTSRAVATSGDYMNAFTSDFALHHILDPASGQSPRDLASATVLASTAYEADALATALMVLGSQDAMKLVERLPNVDAILVTKELEILSSLDM